jgi:hypothetical protein
MNLAHSINIFKDYIYLFIKISEFFLRYHHEFIILNLIISKNLLKKII